MICRLSVFLSHYLICVFDAYDENGLRLVVGGIDRGLLCFSAVMMFVFVWRGKCKMFCVDFFNLLSLTGGLHQHYYCCVFMPLFRFVCKG